MRVCPTHGARSRSQSSNRGPDCWAVGTRGALDRLGRMKTSDDLHDGQDERSPDAGAWFDAVLEPLTRAADRFGQIGIIQRWGWLIAMGVAVVIAGIGIGIFVLALLLAGWPDFWFHDLEVLLDATRRLFAGESWYLE